MANRGEVWVNADGLKVGFGRRTTENETTAHIETQGLGKELIRKVSPGTVVAATGYVADNDDIPILGGAVVTAVAFKVYEDFDADVTVNLVDAEGTIVEADVLSETAPAKGAYGGSLAAPLFTTDKLYVEVVSTATEGYGELFIAYNVSTSFKV